MASTSSLAAMTLPPQMDPNPDLGSKSPVVDRPTDDRELGEPGKGKRLGKYFLTRFTNQMGRANVMLPCRLVHYSQE